MSPKQYVNYAKIVKKSISNFDLGYARRWQNMKQGLHKIMNTQNILL